MYYFNAGYRGISNVVSGGVSIVSYVATSAVSIPLRTLGYHSVAQTPLLDEFQFHVADDEVPIHFDTDPVFAFSAAEVAIEKGNTLQPSSILILY